MADRDPRTEGPRDEMPRDERSQDDPWGRRRTGDDTSHDPPPGRPVPRAFGLRIALYVLATALGMWASGSVLFTIFWPEYLDALSDPEVAPPVLPGLLMQALITPVILAITAGFAAFDRRTAADLGLCLPRAEAEEGEADAVGSPIAAVQHVALAVAGSVAILSGWRLVAASFATFEQAETFAADELEQLAGWLPLDLVGLVTLGLGLLVASVATEVMFRGYIFAVLRERLPWIHAAGLSALFFAFFSATAPEVLAPSLLDLFLIGLILAAVRERSGSLLFGIVFHGSWNLYLGCVLSLPVSGNLLPRQKPMQVDGPLWVTGGEFGPEGSWLLTGFLLLAVLAATAWVEAGRDPEPAEAEDEDP